MKILVIGSGGREHALCWKIAQSPRCDKLYCAPGNDGISKIAEIVDIKSDDINGLFDFANAQKIDLTVVGPEMPLVSGITDLFQKRSLRIFGPSKRASQLEGSKVFAKEMMKRFGIPTARFEVFDNYDDAEDYVKSQKMPLVIKADGLAQGKGVTVAHAHEEALSALKSAMIEKVFGKSGERIIIEECLSGEEASIIVISDGKNVVPMAASQDHKRALDDDKGQNTGGMGAYSPAPLVTVEIEKRIMDDIILPMINGLSKDDIPYKGALYAGIMLTKEGPKTLEFNVRFGDPETQAVLPRLKSDLVELMECSVSGDLKGYESAWDEKRAVCVVLASGGYPASYEKGKEMHGLDEAEKIKDIIIFHAGTKLIHSPQSTVRRFVSDGGRVLNVTALGGTIKEAIDKCYDAVNLIKFEGMYFRKDIGYKAIE